MADKEYPGIDYGMGQANVDKKTGIRYGVISQHEVLQAWCDSSEPYYGEPHCPHCGNDLPEDFVDANDSSEEDGGKCPHCGKVIEDKGMECYPDEPISHFIDDEEYSAECGEDGDIFITKSPYYTRAQFCSPCAPGAGYLMNPCKDGPKCYCFGHDWFEDGKAPYPVYRASDDTLVEPEKE